MSIIIIILAEIFSKSLNGSVKQVEVGRIFSFYVREIVVFFRDRATTLFFESFHTLGFLSCPFVSNSFELVFFQCYTLSIFDQFCIISNAVIPIKSFCHYNQAQYPIIALHTCTVKKDILIHL